MMYVFTKKSPKKTIFYMEKDDFYFMSEFVI